VTAPAPDGRRTPLRFTSRDQRVLDAWAGGQAALAAYTTRVGEILAAAQAGALVPAYNDAGEFTGLTATPSDVLPPGWRHTGALAVPDPQVAAGRWAAEAIARAWHPGDPRRSLPGLPPAVAQPQALPGWRAELLERGTALYAGWPAGADGGGQPDPRLWKPVTPARALAAATTGGERR
jgi:hypothetical protein